MEFNRTVCMDYTDFLAVFDVVDAITAAKGGSLHQERTPKTMDNTIHLINFSGPPDECKKKKKLGGETKVLYLKGNSYPRWPPLPDNFFFQFYRAKKTLEDALPYQQAPKTVVHLRAPDNPNRDFRAGLDDTSLEALGKLLPGDTYLVTN